jgi:hypothetical protein
MYVVNGGKSAENATRKEFQAMNEGGGKADRARQSHSGERSIIRSSAAEYLTFVAASGEGGVEAAYADETIWLTQKMMATLYDVDVRTVNCHLKKIFSDSELQEDSVIRKFRITAADRQKLHHQSLYLSMNRQLQTF